MKRKKNTKKHRRRSGNAAEALLLTLNRKKYLGKYKVKPDWSRRNGKNDNNND